MGRARFFLLVTIAVGAAACALPDHRPAPVSAPPPSVAHEPRRSPSSVKVAVFEPGGSGNWAGTLELSPAPASAIAACLEPGAVGWLSVNVETHGNEASTTSIVETSSDTTAEARACVANALTSVHVKTDPMRFLLYITFSAE